MFPVVCLGIYGSKGTIQQYIVFRGTMSSITENDVFSNEELAVIRNHSIPIHYSSVAIYPDDSIYLIKQKITQECKSLNITLTVEEVYLFFQQQIQTLSAFSVFETFLHTHKHTPIAPQLEQESIPQEEMTAVEFGQLITNYGLNLTPELEERIRRGFQSPDSAETFSYDDWKTVWPWDNRVSKFQPLGQQPPPSVIREDPLFSANPFFLHYSYLKQHTPVAMNTAEGFLLMNFIPETAMDSMSADVPTILSISMCSAEGVLQFFQEKGETDVSENSREEELLAMYFPHLFHTHQVVSYSGWVEYNKNRPQQPPVPVQNRELDLFYELYASKSATSEAEPGAIENMYRKKGITSFLFSLLPENQSLKLPLEYLFRNLSATMETPYVQYNPGEKQEILYRLYSEKFSQNGKKIPYLDRDVLRRWAKQIRNKKRSFLTLAIFPPQQQPPSSGSKRRASFTQKYQKKWSGDLFLRVYANGEMEIEGKPTTSWEEYSLETCLIDSIAPIIQKINTWLQSSGYKLPLLRAWLPVMDMEKSFDKNVDIRERIALKVLDMSYEWELEISKVLLEQIEEKRNWLSSAFYYTSDWNDETTKQKKGGPTLTFRRVENYQTMETESQWIAFYLKQNYSDEKIIERLQTEHSVSKDGAIELYTRYLQDFQTEKRNREMNVPGRGWKRGQKQIRVKNTNPGFPTSFQFQTIDHCLITVENICGFSYLNMLQIYVYGIYRLAKGLPASFQARLLDKKNVARQSSMMESIPEIVSDKGAIDDFGEAEEDTGAIDDYGEEEDDDEEQEPGYIGTKFSEKNVEYFDKVASPKLGEEPEAESSDSEDESSDSEAESSDSEAEQKPDAEAEQKPDAVESEVESEDDSSVISELHYDEYEEEEEEEKGGEKGGKKQTPPKSKSKTSTGKLEKDIMSILKASFFSNKPIAPSNSTVKSGAPELKSVAVSDAQYKNQNVGKYWVERMKKRDPGLFELYAKKEEEVPNFKVYTRTCQINDQRQPILINEEEKQRIDRENPGSYTYALPYKSSPESPSMYYICPRYWCFKTGTSMTEEDVQQGKCGPPGNAVPSNFNSSKATENVSTALVKFDNKKQHRDADGNYIQNNPGFIKHDDICMPCCFKRARPEVSCEESRQVGEYTSNDYIITDETKRLEPMKWGFLPIAIQSYFQYFPNLKETMDGKRLKLHKPMLLRHGVEQFPNQSFLGVMADWYSAIHGLEETVGVREFRSILASAISLDQFLQYNNGSLVSAFRVGPKQNSGKAFPSETPALITSTFSSPEVIASSSTKKKKNPPEDAIALITPEDVDYTQSKYTSSVFVKRIQPDSDAKRAIVNDAIVSYENFLQFLENPNSEIDPTYLWDVIAQPNPALYPKGFNLVLLSKPDNDMTQNVDLVCPSIVYSSQIFDMKKESAIVLLHNGFYEPIYMLERTDKENERTTKFFLSKNSSVLNGLMNRVMNMVHETIQTQCSPKPSLKTYTFERPIYLSDLVATLENLKSTYVITGHVWNYSGKIIGLQVSPYPQPENKKKSIVVPCFPTTHSPLFTKPKHEANHSNRFMDDKELWVDFPTTLSLLRKLNKDSKDAADAAIIPCVPVIEVVEEDMIVGILTQTNQFVAIQPPVAYKSIAPPVPAMQKKMRALEKDLNTELMVLHSVNYIQADIAVSTAPQPDPEREKWVRDIRLENKFYSVFRSTARLELNLFENRPLRKEVIGIIQRYNQGRIKYNTTVKQFAQLLRTMLQKVVRFIDFDDKIMEELYRLSREQDFSSCVSGQTATEPYCLYSSEPSVLITSASTPKTENKEEQTGEEQTGGEGATEKRGILLLPRKNRVKETADNEKGYYIRLADELLRFPRIQNYLLFPTSYLNVQSTEYKIKPTEIILLQSVLVPETPEDDYFKNIKQPANTNRHVKQLPYALTEPIKTQPYSNVISGNDPIRKPLPVQSIKIAKKVDETAEPEEEPDAFNSQERTSVEQYDLAEQQRIINEFQIFYDKCVAQSITVIGSVNNSTWKRMFPKKSKEVVYHGSSSPQSFCCIMNIIYSYLKRPVPLSEMKKQLIEAYRPWLNTPIAETEKKIMKLLSKYNSGLVKQWKHTGDWEGMFLNEEYIATELDFWVVANELQLPVILFTSNSLKNLFPYQKGIPPVKWLLLYPHRVSEKHYFVRPPTGIDSGNIAPSYHKIEPAIGLNTLKDVIESPLTLEEQVQDGLSNTESPYAKNVLSLEEYLKMP